MPRVSSKDKYIVQVFELFKSKGLMLNMEQIALEIGLTKKTLYNNFVSKNELIQTVLNYFYSEMDKKIQVSAAQSINAIEAFINVSVIISEEMAKLGTLLLRDISIYQSSPDIFTYSDRINFYSKLVNKNLDRGIEEDLYRKNINKKYSALFYTSAIESFYRWEGSFKHFNRMSEYHRELVIHHLYSVVNDNGAKVLGTYLNK